MTNATRTMVMTGATRGLGKHAAIHLLRAAPDLHLVVIARSTATQSLRDDFIATTGNGNVSVVTADLASFASIRAAAATVRAQVADHVLPALHGFVGNAGLQLLDAMHATIDGFETTFAVNVLANHLFIHELADLFIAPARIILTTSDTHFGDFAHNLGLVPAPRWRAVEDLARPGTAENAGTTTAGRIAYSTSKLGVIYLVHELARRLPAGVAAYAFNPGLVPGTDLARAAGPISRFVFRAILPVLTMTPIATRPDVAGANLAAAAISVLPGESGTYINSTRTEPSSAESYNRDREMDVWNTGERLSRNSGVVTKHDDRSFADPGQPQPWDRVRLAR